MTARPDVRASGSVRRPQRQRRDGRGVSKRRRNECAEGSPGFFHPACCHQKEGLASFTPLLATRTRNEGRPSFRPLATGKVCFWPPEPGVKESRASFTPFFATRTRCQGRPGLFYPAFVSGANTPNINATLFRFCKIY